MSKMIILLGQRVRSGTNFIGTTLAMHPDVVTVPPGKSLGEFNLFRDALIEQTFDQVALSSFGMDIQSEDKSRFLELYGEAWLKLLKEKYAIPNEKTIFVKSYVINNLHLWQKAFPNAKIAVIYRDGRDNVISSVKASNDYRNWHGGVIKLKKRCNYYSGRSFLNHARHWVKTAEVILAMQESNHLKKFKYEALNDSKKGIAQLLDFYELKNTPDIVNNCLKAPVVGSSFGVQTKTLQKPNWIPDPDKSKYRFTNKWKHWNKLKKGVFKKVGGATLQRLGYETSNKW